MLFGLVLWFVKTRTNIIYYSLLARYFTKDIFTLSWGLLRIMENCVHSHFSDEQINLRNDKLAQTVHLLQAEAKSVGSKVNPFLSKVGNSKFNWHQYLILRCTLSAGSQYCSFYLNIVYWAFRLLFLGQ